MEKIKTLLISLLLFSANLQAAGSGGNASSIFNFQQKLAAKGNVQAQYQSGFMYETGEGVEQDRDLARLWYQKAADQGHVTASYRLTYLDIKQHGFDSSKHAQWLRKVKKNASLDKQEILFLLGQMYREGIGLKKNLNKSLEIMYQLGFDGMTAADAEIEKIQAELKANEIRRQKARAENARKQARRATQKAVTPAGAKPVAASPAGRKSAMAADDKDARRKRYEAIMKKLAEEQAEINRLQGLVDDEAEVDDEI